MFSQKNLNNTNVNASPTLNNFVTSELVTKAEILYALAQIVTKGSLREFELVAELFPIMFPDNNIAKKFSMHKNKLSYVITHGLGPYLQEELTMYVQKQEYFAISFDESLNKVAQKGQMDLIIRFWRDEKSVETRYLTSTFLHQAKATDLLNAFISAITNSGLSLKKIIQVSMDGPNVNLKFLKYLKAHLADSDNADTKKLIEFGTCGLHVVNGSYRTGHDKS